MQPNLDILASPPPSLSPDQARHLLEHHWGLSPLSLEKLASERDLNYKVEMGKARFVLKLANLAEPEAVTKLQTQALLHIAAKAPHLPVPRVIKTRSGANEAQFEGSTLRLLTYLEGLPLHLAKASSAQVENLAKSHAELVVAMHDFSNPIILPILQWDIQHASSLAKYLPDLPPDLRSLIADVLARFEQFVSPKLAHLRRQFGHSDLNPFNILVQAENPNQLAGFLDFGDMVKTPIICDVAVAAAYQLDEALPAFQDVGHYAQHFHRIFPLTPMEWEVLPELVMARLATTICIATSRAKAQPENQDYILRNVPKALAGLQRLHKISHEQAIKRIEQAALMKISQKADGKMINGFVPGQAQLSPETENLIATRQKHLGPAYRLFYEKPLHIVKGEDVWLIDEQGKKYLDAYNNVASIGHCHPHVVAAITKQASHLATNTRYLSQDILLYAERLLATFPEALAHVMFTCTGSEANDLAMRLAKDFTRAEGFIVTENAYHGVTMATAGLSPSLGPGVGLAPNVRAIPAPLHGDGDLFAQHVAEAIADLRDCAIKPAALICDSIFSSDGVAADPKGFLKPAYDLIHQQGGLFIADEVQAGFARTGAGMWGFSRHDIVPDMVSLGKPMGNGYPVAGLVMRPEIVAEFGAKARYFNTFGGNSVAIAAANAVLDVIESQDLIANAQNMGAKLHKALADVLPLPQIRAAGLYFGLDILDSNGLPDAKKASRIVNQMAQNGVLISATGPMGHVLKIRPPLTFTDEHVAIFARALKKSVKESLD